MDLENIVSESKIKVGAKIDYIDAAYDPMEVADLGECALSDPKVKVVFFRYLLSLFIGYQGNP
jgi:hypothetical protein